MTVDEALEESMTVDEALAESDLVGRPYSGGSEAMIVLAAEVRRLRANLARVEALVPLWKRDRVFVVDELEAALRDE